jgi:hypothetical protein
VQDDRHTDRFVTSIKIGDFLVAGRELNPRHAHFQPLTGCFRGLSINHLQRLADPLPRHTKAQSWHTQSELVRFLAQETLTLRDPLSVHCTDAIIDSYRS